MTTSTDASIKTVALLGKPGSGKGTQAELLRKKTGWTVFSSGNRFREIAAEDTPLGRRTKDTIDRGILMPPWYPTFIFQEAVLRLGNDEGIIFEGSARTKEEGEKLHETMEWLERPYKAFYLTVDESVIADRINARIKNGSQRADDDLSKLQTRFDQFNTLTMPAVEYLRQQGNLIEIDGMRTPNEVHKDISKYLNL